MTVTTIPVGMLGTNCYLIQSPNGSCVVVDPGAQPDKIIREIKELNLTPKFILLTHGHHDHIGGVKKLMSAFPEASLHIGRDDLEMLGDSQKSLAIFRQPDDSEFIIGSARAAEEGDVFEAGELSIRVIETPGHTRGGVSYVCQDAVFSGDTLFLEDVGRTDLYGGDYEVLKKSLSKLAALEGDYIVYPGHGESTTMSHERHNNTYIPKEGGQ